MYQNLRDAIKVRNSEIFINDEKKTVFCKLETVLGTFEGKAKCSPKDTFDAAVGKKIAYNRALRQANAFAKVNIREKVVKPTMAILAELDARMDKSASIIKTELDKLGE